MKLKFKVGNKIKWHIKCGRKPFKGKIIKIYKTYFIVRWTDNKEDTFAWINSFVEDMTLC